MTGILPFSFFTLTDDAPLFSSVTVLFPTLYEFGRAGDSVFTLGEFWALDECGEKLVGVPAALLIPSVFKRPLAFILAACKVARHLSTSRSSSEYNFLL